MPELHGSRPRWSAIVASALTVATTPVVVWWTIGQGTVDDPHPDYMIRPPKVDGTVELVAGSVATTLLITSLAALVVWTLRAQLPREWWSVLLPLVIGGGVAGMAERAMTAGVIGANIGGALMVPFVPVVTLCMIATSAFCAQRGPWRYN